MVKVIALLRLRIDYPTQLKIALKVTLEAGST